MQRKMIVLMITALAVGMAVQVTWAHEFIVQPVQLAASVGHKLPLSVVSAHVFVVSEEMEPIEQVDLALVKGDTREKVSLVPNEMLLTLDGAVELKQQGTYVLAGHRKGILWTHTTKGWQQAGKKGLQGVISSGKYEKFCKTLVVSGQADDGYKKVVGDRLEIVPIDDPQKVAVGQDLNVQILFDGKPMPTEVYATYDGFTTVPNTYAYFTETDENGRARIRLTHDGTWMVRVQHKVNEATDDYDQYILRAVLVFGVR